jgi:hypothetical protein
MFMEYNRRGKGGYCHITCAGLSMAMARENTSWSVERSSVWWEDVVLETYNDQQWLENFRMGRRTFVNLCRELEQPLKPNESFVRVPVDVKKQVAIAIYFLGSSAEYRTIGNLFGFSTSTICEVVHMVCETIAENLLEKYVSFPTGSNRNHGIQGYEGIWVFPNCGGAIDGCHISIKAPENSHGDSLNRKGLYSLILQGVCDYKYVFTDINIGWPGRVHDGRLFANSEIFHKGENGTLFPKWTKKIVIQR